MERIPLEFAAGTKFRYNNTGYVILGLVIEKVAGKPYGEFLHERIFAPLPSITSPHRKFTSSDARKPVWIASRSSV